MSPLGAAVGSVPSSLERGSRSGPGVCPQPTTPTANLALEGLGYVQPQNFWTFLSDTAGTGAGRGDSWP